MTAFLLRYRLGPADLLKEERFLAEYFIYGEFYEENSNAHGGTDYIARELEIFLKKNRPEAEHENLKNYSDALAKMNIFSELLVIKSKNSYLRANYSLYRVYVKKN